MSSKYDGFWIAVLPELRTAIERAAIHDEGAVAITAVRALGTRQSWYGTASVRGHEIEHASMAQMRSLAKQIARSRLCMPWPDTSFRFTMSADGTTLRVTRGAVERAESSPLQQVTGRSTRQQSTISIMDPGADVEATTACEEIHRLVARLPEFHRPSDVDFNNGLYFFYEVGEHSAHGPTGRIVRIGNHPRAQDRLVGRLKDHYRSTSGAKNGSVFRRYIGGALLRRDDTDSSCLSPGAGLGHWEHQGGDACARCARTEADVTEVLSSRFHFRCVRVDDMADRNLLEGRLIASVAACPACRPSPDWLGRSAYPVLVKRSGLWNAQHVEGSTATADDMMLFRQLVAATVQSSPASRQPLDDTLLIIPCSSAKKGSHEFGLPPVRVADLLNPTLARSLDDGRRAAFGRPATELDLGSPLRAALEYYSGQPYATPGVRDALVAAIRRGLHCLIVSGGYGIVRAEEPIHRYNAHLSSHTRSVWAGRLPRLLRDYVTRNGISRTITVVSSGYAAVVPDDLTGEDIRVVPVFVRGVDKGAALRIVPERVGVSLANVLREL